MNGCKVTKHARMILWAVIVILTLAFSGCKFLGTEQNANPAERAEKVEFRGMEIALPDGSDLIPECKPYYSEGKIRCLVTVAPTSVEAENEDNVREVQIINISLTDEHYEIVEKISLKDSETITNGVLLEKSYVLLIHEAQGECYILKQGNERKRTVIPITIDVPIRTIVSVQDENLWAASDYEIVLLGEDGQAKRFVSPGGKIVAVHADGQGGVWAIIHEESTEAVKIESSGSIEERFSVPYTEEIAVLGQTLYITTDTGIQAIENGRSTLYVDYLKSNIAAAATKLLEIPDEEHILASKAAGGKQKLYIYHRKNESDSDDIRVLEIGCVTRYGLSQYIAERVVAFNNTHNEVQVKVTDYRESYKDLEMADSALGRDLVTGIFRPDLLIYDLGEEQKYQRAAVEHGLTLDLTAYLNADEKLNLNTLVGSATRACRYGNTIWGVPVDMTFSTLIVPDALLGSQLSGRSYWTLTEELDLLESLSDDILPCVNCSQDTAIGALLGENGLAQFIDRQSGTCSFDSEEFVRLLRYISTRPVDWEELTKVSIVDKTPYNKRTQYYHTGKVAMKNFYVTNALDYISLEAEFGTTDVTKIGYPVSGLAQDEQGYDLIIRDTISIMTTCDAPSDAWDFLKFVVTGEHGSTAYLQFMAAYKPLLETQIPIGTWTLFKYDGTSITDSRRELEELNRNGGGILAEYTQKMADELMSILDTAGKSVMDEVPSDIKAIVGEELSAMTAGISSPEQCAQKIQSRASIWMAEHH